MTCRIFLRFGILAVLGALCLPSRAYSQSQGCLNAASPSPAAIPRTKINVASVEFSDENPLSDALRAQLAREIQHSELWVAVGEPDSSWITEALTPIREALRSQGYFKTNVDATSYLTLAQATQRSYVLSVMIEAGPQYRLGKLTFASATGTPLHFTDAELREQMNLQDGELFDVQKIRKGLESLGKLYGSKGYIDATPEPDTTIDEKDSRIDLLVKVDEGKSYRIAKIDFPVLQGAAHKSPRPPQEVGDTFNMTSWKSFFEESKSHFSADASLEKNMLVRRDARNGTVSITLDFRPCPNIHERDE
jgi:outer membrane protein assembly factor BamA